MLQKCTWQRSLHVHCAPGSALVSCSTGTEQRDAPAAECRPLLSVWRVKKAGERVTLELLRCVEYGAQESSRAGDCSSDYVLLFHPHPNTPRVYPVGVTHVGRVAGVSGLRAMMALRIAFVKNQTKLSCWWQQRRRLSSFSLWHILKPRHPHCVSNTSGKCDHWVLEQNGRFPNEE